MLKKKNRRKKNTSKNKNRPTNPDKGNILWSNVCISPTIPFRQRQKKKKKPVLPVVVYTKATTGLNETKGFCTTARAFGAAGISTG